MTPIPNIRPKLKLPSFIGEILRTLFFVVVVTILLDMAIPRSIVDGSSMQPTFEDGERLIISRVHYLFTPPERGDVVVFNAVETRNHGEMLIKRVIGIPGDMLEIRDRQVYINGTMIDEPYILEACRINCNDDVWQLGMDEYFVMGDNRNHSNDSRSFAAVPLSNIIGRVIFRYWPPEDISVFE